MKILLASSEVHPFSKTGGLADMVGAMGKSLARAGHEVAVISPLYRGVAKKVPELRREDYVLDIPLGDRRVEGELWSFEEEERLTVSFLRQPGYFDRPGLYQENGVDYPDNAERYTFFCKCVAHIARHHPFKPDVVHGHDWQAGLVPVFIHFQEREDGWTGAPATCLTIHNLAYQGVFAKTAFALTNLPWSYFTPQSLEYYGGINFLKAAILFSDMLTTVSPRYAREITTEALGCGLDDLLRKRQADLAGILNGVDYSEWQTLDNPYLLGPYSIETLDEKRKQKEALQLELGLPVDASVPLFGTVTRLAEQKGLDIQIAALEEMLPNPMQFALLGSGEAKYELALRRLALRHPTKVAVRIGYDHGLSHRIEAGSDFFLMPSRFEPCGLNQMYSLRYGAIPIVRVTGGLDDSVVDINESFEKANGIKFQEYSPRALAKAIRKALTLFQNRELMEHFLQNGMAMNFSWEKTSAEYLAVYRRALAMHPSRVALPFP